MVNKKGINSSPAKRKKYFLASLTYEIKQCSDNSFAAL